MRVYDKHGIAILLGDVRDEIATITDASVQCVVTSPPYWNLRDYGHDGQMGRENTPAEYIAEMAGVFREVHRVLADDGVLWLNLGDSYSSSGSSHSSRGATSKFRDDRSIQDKQVSAGAGDRPAKNLLGIPWRVAFALQDDGWILRQDIIWDKGNSMPESVKDRCTRSHEYLFMFSKRPHYYYDAAAIAEESIYKPGGSHSDVAQGGFNDKGATPWTGQRSFRAIRETKNKRTVWDVNTGEQDKQQGHGPRHAGFNARYADKIASDGIPTKRNKRSVWRINTGGYGGAHFAVMPEKLVEPCILAGSRTGDTVLDPFAGSGTTLAVAQKFGRRGIGIELNPDYIPLIKERLQQPSLPLEI